MEKKVGDIYIKWLVKQRVIKKKRMKKPSNRSRMEKGPSPILHKYIISWQLWSDCDFLANHHWNMPYLKGIPPRIFQCSVNLIWGSRSLDVGFPTKYRGWSAVFRRFDTPGTVAFYDNVSQCVFRWPTRSRCKVENIWFHMLIHIMSWSSTKLPIDF